jgi:hypothetical protein
MEVANTLAYNNMATITTVKSFMAQALGGYSQNFYDHLFVMGALS